ncbi:MAG TPA: aminotransferase class V-fold PLP-dependent enzyme [Candidatus Dormibacteraeota bacterium]
MSPLSGRHFLQIPGPTNVPDRVLRAMDRAVVDHRGPELPEVTLEAVERLKHVFRTETGSIAMWAGSGTGAWEAAIVNTLRPGERALAFNNGIFAEKFSEVARRFGVVVDEVDMRWGDAVAPDRVAGHLRPEHAAVLIVHNETSTGVTTDVGGIRAAIDSTGHDPLLLVDTVSSLGSIDFRFDDWRVDVALTGSQKGLMLPPGMAFVCVSPRALERSREVDTPRSFYDWGPVIAAMQTGYFPATPPTLELYGLREALRMLEEEGLDNVYARHTRLAEGVRQAVQAWDLTLLCTDLARCSNSLTAVAVDGIDADAVLREGEAHLHLSLGAGLGRLKGRAFRIGHLGALNELEVIATLGGVELALNLAGEPVELGSGVAAAMRYWQQAGW